MTKQEYLLVCLAEECGEVQRAVAKALRFGLNDICPENGATANHNITQELADLMAVFSMCKDELILAPIQQPMIDKKRERMKKYMEYSQTVGRLD